MKALFLIPEIDKKKLGKKLAKLRKDYELTQSNLECVGNDVLSEELVSQYEHGRQLPPLDRFLNICVFYGISPELMLAECTKTKIIEVEIEKIDKFYNSCSILLDINSKKSTIEWNLTLRNPPESFILIGPKNLRTLIKENKDILLSIHRYFFIVRNKMASYIETHTLDNSFYTVEEYNPFFNVDENIKKLRSPLKIRTVYDETVDKINSLISEYKLSKNNLKRLLGFKTEMSVYRLITGKQTWGIRHLYKLSWILGINIEHLLGYTVDWTEGVITQEFDPVYFLEHYSSDNNKY